jgi:hypothetical protein
MKGVHLALVRLRRTSFDQAPRSEFSFLFHAKALRVQRWFGGCYLIFGLAGKLKTVFDQTLSPEADGSLNLPFAQSPAIARFLFISRKAKNRKDEALQLFYSIFAALREFDETGFVNIFGRPNAGKSTLLNLLMERNSQLFRLKCKLQGIASREFSQKKITRSFFPILRASLNRSTSCMKK